MTACAKKEYRVKVNWRDNYYIGLDIGVASVGWAVTDDEYSIPRVKGKRAWGVRLFEEAQSAATRRVFRSVRRRKQREKQRVKYLRMIFCTAVHMVDPDFFKREDESFYLEADKKTQQKNTLFNDPGYTDKEYARDFPSIWHLRKYLVSLGQGGQREKPVDIRHYYLAILHLIKNRGHFLFSGDLDTSTSFQRVWECFEQQAEEFGFYYTADACEIIQALVSDAKMPRKDKKRILIEQLALDRMNEYSDCYDEGTRTDEQAKKLMGLLAGTPTKVSDVFVVDSNEKIDFNKNFSEEADALSAVIDDSALALLESAKALYDYGRLASILGEHQYLCNSMVVLYEQHAEDLKLLKQVVPDNAENHIFYHYALKREKDDKSYYQYARHNVLLEDFVKQCKKLACAANESTVKDRLLDRLQCVDFMPLQKGYYRGVIPNQLHRNELKHILDALVAQYPEFETQRTNFRNDPTSISDVEKIQAMLSFRYPYWAGPLGKLSDTNEGYTVYTRQDPWAIKRPEMKNAKVYPWNFYEVVDTARTACAFIDRLANNCTYLYDQKVIPKYSLLYQRYLVLNDLNNLKLNGRRIDCVQLKQTIYSDLFSKEKTISKRRLGEFIKCETGEVYEIGLGDVDDEAGRTISSKLSSYQDFVGIFSTAFVDAHEEEVEQAILSISSLPDSRDMVLTELKKIFADDLATGEATLDQLEQLANKQYSGWAPLSRELLAGLQGVDSETGEIKPGSIIDMMWSTNKNFMELVATSGSDFGNAIQIHNEKLASMSAHQIVNGSWASPPVKRAIFQAKKVVDELIDLIGKPPAKVFVETTREGNVNAKKKRTTSRKMQLQKQYEGIKNDNEEVVRELGNASDQALQSKRLYLYFSQMGKCAYSGEPIELAQVNSNLYDIDHIIPRSYIKDDSLHSNLVLVKRECNATKSNLYPVPRQFQQQKGLWEEWQRLGLISKTKLHRLMRTEPLTEADKEGFVARQLVETSQAVKLMRDLLQYMMPEGVEVILAKASVTSDFRKQMVEFERDAEGRTLKDQYGAPIIKLVLKPEFVKVRELNDLHHAKDAYLAVVCGNVLSAKFTKNPRTWFARKNDIGKEKNNLSKLFWHEQKEFSSGKVVWNTDQLLTNVIATMERNDILVTKMLEDKTNKGRGFYLLQLVKKSNNKLIPIKTGDSRFDKTDVYGGWDGTTYSSVYILKVNNKLKIVPMPTRFKDNPGSVIGDAEILGKPLLFNTLVKRDGVFPMRITGGNELSPSVQNTLSADQERYLKRITNLFGEDGKAKANENYTLTPFDRIDAIRNEDLFDALIKKLSDSVYQYHPKKDSFLKQIETPISSLEPILQAKVIFELLKFFTAKSPQSMDLSAIGGKGGDNRLRVSSFGDLNKMKIIQQSITGILEHEIDVATPAELDSSDQKTLKDV
jgi:CRISPR-associated endonuclease Csn1